MSSLDRDHWEFAVEQVGDMKWEVKVNRWLTHGREWVARITGLSRQFGLERAFLPAVSRNWSRSGKNGTTTFMIGQPGWYEVSCPSIGTYGNDARTYIEITPQGEWNDRELRQVRDHFKDARAQGHPS